MIAEVSEVDVIAEVSEVDVIAEVFVVQEGGSSEVVVTTRIDEVLF